MFILFPASDCLVFAIPRVGVLLVVVDIFHAFWLSGLSLALGLKPATGPLFIYLPKGYELSGYPTTDARISMTYCPSGETMVQRCVLHMA